jgi:hypothetical protein
MKIDNKPKNELKIVSPNEVNITIDLKESLKTLLTITCAIEEKRMKTIDLIKSKRLELSILPQQYCAHCYNLKNVTAIHSTSNCFNCH